MGKVVQHVSKVKQNSKTFHQVRQDLTYLEKKESTSYRTACQIFRAQQKKCVNLLELENPVKSVFPCKDRPRTSPPNLGTRAVPFIPTPCPDSLLPAQVRLLPSLRPDRRRSEAETRRKRSRLWTERNGRLVPRGSGGDKVTFYVYYLHVITNFSNF